MRYNKYKLLLLLLILLLLLLLLYTHNTRKKRQDYLWIDWLFWLVWKYLCTQLKIKLKILIHCIVCGWAEKFIWWRHTVDNFFYLWHSSTTALVEQVCGLPRGIILKNESSLVTFYESILVVLRTFQFFSLVSLFNDISTFVGYLMPKSFS